MSLIKVYNRHAIDNTVEGNSPVSYELARTSSALYAASNAGFCVGQNFSSPQNDMLWHVRRPLLSFDTSWIGNRTIKSAKLCMMIYGANPGSVVVNFDVLVQKFTWAEPLDGTTMESNFDGALAAVTDVVFANTADIPAGVYVTSPALDIAWINTSGITRYALVNSHDQADVFSGGDEHLHFDNSGNVPYLLLEVQGRPLWQPNPMGQMNRHFSPLGV